MTERSHPPGTPGAGDSEEVLVTMLRDMGRQEPPAPPLEEMWAAIEPVAFPRTRRR